ncbi:MAG: ribosome small subunit-dependent GTPase A [Actinomycetales bacterium]
MSRRGRELDEDDVRVRPGRGTRPRTKERPRHEDAATARVVAVDRGRYTCLLRDADGEGHRHVTAAKARELGRQGVVVGDEVRLVGDVTGDAGSLARVVGVEPRRTVLRRTADDVDPVERVIVANADQLAIVTAVADPEPRLGLIDRCLVAAYDAGLEPLLVLTKTDLRPPDELLATYAALDVPAVTLGRLPDVDGHHGDLVGLAALRAELAGRWTVLVGHSGVGKSTLVNALVPGATRTTGAVNDVTGRGRHTSTSAVALELPPTAAGTEESSDEAWVVDTPGVRSFGLAHIDPSRVVAAFPDLAAGTDECPRSCSHDEPECGLDAWVAAGHADPARLASLRRLLRSRESSEQRDGRETSEGRGATDAGT